MDGGNSGQCLFETVLDRSGLPDQIEHPLGFSYTLGQHSLEPVSTDRCHHPPGLREEYRRRVAALIMYEAIDLMEGLTPHRQDLKTIPRRLPKYRQSPLQEPARHPQTAFLQFR